MDWKEILSKLKIVDVKIKPEANQMGVVNMQYENKSITYNIFLSDPETAKAFASSISITPAIEKAIKNTTAERLSPLDDTLKQVSENATIEITAAATAVSTPGVIIRSWGQKTPAGYSNCCV